MTEPVATDRELDRLLARRLRQLADSLDGSGLQPSPSAREAADDGHWVRVRIGHPLLVDQGDDVPNG